MYLESNLFISFVGTSTCGNTINEDSWTFLVQCMFGYMHDYLQRMVALKMMLEWFNTMNGRVHEYPPTCIGGWPLNFLCTYSAKRHLLKCPFTPWPNLDKAIGIPCIHQPSSEPNLEETFSKVHSHQIQWTWWHIHGSSSECSADRIHSPKQHNAVHTWSSHPCLFSWPCSHLKDSSRLTFHTYFGHSRSPLMLVFFQPRVAS